jgi:virginiamycin B lyase
MSEWSGGQISHYSPSTGKWERIPLPGNARANLYAVYVDNKDVVWVSNWADDKIYGYDPATKKFSSVPGNGVRQILGIPGQVYLPEGTGAITVINTGGSAS